MSGKSRSKPALWASCAMFSTCTEWPPSRQNWAEIIIVLGVRGVTNVMKYLGMLEGGIVPPARPQVTIYGSHLDKVRASRGGIWVAEVKAGERVRKGQGLGHIYSIRTFEVTERLSAPYDGFVLGTADMPIINIGDALVAICRLEK